MRMDQYRVESVDCKLHQCGGDVEYAELFTVSPQTLLEVLSAFFPRIEEDIDATGRIVLTIEVRET